MTKSASSSVYGSLRLSLNSPTSRHNFNNGNCYQIVLYNKVAPLKRYWLRIFFNNAYACLNQSINKLIDWFSLLILRIRDARAIFNNINKIFLEMPLYYKNNLVTVSVIDVGKVRDKIFTVNWAGCTFGHNNHDNNVALMCIVSFEHQQIGFKYLITMNLALYTVHSGRYLSLIHIWRCRRLLTCRSRWSPYH